MCIIPKTTWSIPHFDRTLHTQDTIVTFCESQKSFTCPFLSGWRWIPVHKLADEVRFPKGFVYAFACFVLCFDRQGQTCKKKNVRCMRSSDPGMNFCSSWTWKYRCPHFFSLYVCVWALIKQDEITVRWLRVAAWTPHPSCKLLSLGSLSLVTGMWCLTEDILVKTHRT